MKPLRTRVGGLVLGCAVPFMVQAVFDVLMGALHGHYPESTEIWLSYFTRPISILSGFAFIARAFGRYAVVIAFAYFPIMWNVLLYFSLMLAGIVFGRWL